MFIPVDRLLDGVTETLRREVLPNLSLPRARGQLYAVLDVLDNLRDRVEPKRASANEEAESAEAALRSCAQALRDANSTAEASRIDDLLSDALKLAGDAERAATLRDALASAIALVTKLPAMTASEAATALDQHLLQQTFRDLAGLKLSPLTEISKG